MVPGSSDVKDHMTKKYGKAPPSPLSLPDSNESSIPSLHMMQVYMIGLYKVYLQIERKKYSKDVQLLNVIIIATRLTMISPILSKESQIIAELFNKFWSYRYARPNWIIYDNGNVFTGFELK